jgi:signal transduction histidine kinase
MRMQLGRTREIVTRALDQTRDLILELRPTMLDDLGLVSAVRWYAETHLAPLGVLVAVQTEGRDRALSPEVTTALFRIVQEAINNIVRYAEASSVRILLRWEPDPVTLRVEDNGRGFDVEAVLGARDPATGIGLLGMRERADMIGAALEITSRKGWGTRIEIVLPPHATPGGPRDARPDR